MNIPFNKPFIVGKELFYIAQAVTYGNLGGDGYFTKQCSQLFEQRFSIPKVLMTPSCTAALEMAAMLCELGPGDEVIMPSYTFVSTASSVARLGATPVFVDIRPDTLNLDESKIEAAVTGKTKAIFVVHYGGVACEMDTIMAIAEKHDLIVVEDAAQGVNALYGERPLGSIGHLGCFSFHETKNYVCGEGGALLINRDDMIERAEIIRDKGTNRQKLFRGEVDKYTWVDIGSSYVPSELCSAFLYAQLEEMDRISDRRKEIFKRYRDGLKPLEDQGSLRLPVIPRDCRSNYHLFFVILRSEGDRDSAVATLREAGINAPFHYIPLHSSPMGRTLSQTSSLPVTENLSLRLMRLPMYYELTHEEQDEVIDTLFQILDGNCT